MYLHANANGTQPITGTHRHARKAQHADWVLLIGLFINLFKCDLSSVAAACDCLFDSLKNMLRMSVR